MNCTPRKTQICHNIFDNIRLYLLKSVYIHKIFTILQGNLVKSLHPSPDGDPPITIVSCPVEKSSSGGSSTTTNIVFRSWRMSTRPPPPTPTTPTAFKPIFRFSSFQGNSSSGSDQKSSTHRQMWLVTVPRCDCQPEPLA